MLLQQQHRLQSRDDVKENTSRWALSQFVFTTSGSGSLITGQVTFDCLYVEEPIFTSGVILQQEPNPALFHLPLVTVMVHSWVTQPQEAAAASGVADPTRLYYTGAFLAFAVLVRSLENLTSDVSTAIPILQHHLCFNGLAMKKLSAAIANSKEQIDVPGRLIGFG